MWSKSTETSGIPAATLTQEDNDEDEIEGKEEERRESRNERLTGCGLLGAVMSVWQCNDILVAEMSFMYDPKVI